MTAAETFTIIFFLLFFLLLFPHAVFYPAVRTVTIARRNLQQFVHATVYRAAICCFEI